MATLKTGTTIAGSTAWHAGNDGSGSGLDADTLDGQHASQLMLSQVATTAPTVRRVGDVWVDSDSTYYAPWDYVWQTPGLINGWSNYGAEWGPARYRKTMSGTVIVEGLIKGGTGQIMTFPAGYRPQYNFLTAVIHGGNRTGRVQVGPDGAVIPTFINGDNSFVSMCFWFYASQ